jgi:hypothetical protein
MMGERIKKYCAILEKNKLVDIYWEFTEKYVYSA